MVREGYKQTELGIIPQDWNIKNIGDIADVKTGPFGSALHEKDYVIDGTPIITVEHLGELGVEHTNLPMVSDEDKARLKAYSLKVGDLVFSRVGSIDRNALIKNSESGWLFSGRLLRIRLNSSKEHSQYLSYHFHSIPFKQRVRDVAVGQTMPSLNTQILKGIQIILPTEEEQRSIAQALSDVDALIAALDKLIAKKRHLKTATMQQLLTGKKRLLGFGEGQGYKQSVIGWIPEDWDAAKLGDIAEVIMGQSPKGSSYNRSGNGLALINGPTEFTEKHPIKVQWTTEPTKLCKSEDLLLCVRGSSTGRMNVANDEFCIGRGVAAIRANAKANTEYLTYQVYLAIEKLLSLSAGSTFPSVDGKAIKSIPIPCPDPQEQRAIATVLSNMDAEIAALETRLAKTQAIKQGMMQELLTGRTRLV